MFLIRANRFPKYASLLRSSCYARIHSSYDQRAPIQKKPATSFIRYLKSVYHETAQLENNTSVIEMSALIANRWKEMSDEDKRVYVEAYKKEQEEWMRDYENATEEEVKEYEENKKLLKERREKRAVRKKALEDKDPREMFKKVGSKSVFNYERYPLLRKEHPSLKQQEMFKMLSNEWKELTEESKKRYQDIAAAMRARAGEGGHSFKELYDACYIAC